MLKVSRYVAAEMISRHISCSIFTSKVFSASPFSIELKLTDLIIIIFCQRPMINVIFTFFLATVGNQF